MALARVVSFEGVTSDRMANLKSQIESGNPPEGMPPAELLILHDPEGERSLAIVMVDSEEDYQKAHEVLDSMPGPDTPGTRSSVTKYEVAVRANA
ncbi:MAG TPA: hypothetical protein VE985_02165 [Gaiellaceae bacterium]|jgi:hypothetical protein|nr:hypothetical protein [Gaiellaceae bacterium]